MNNQNTTNNNTGANTNQNLGGMNMNVINQIGALYSQLTEAEMQQVSFGILQSVLADPNRDSILAQAGYVAPQTQPTVNPNMVQVDAVTFNNMVQQMAQLQAQVQQLSQMNQANQYVQMAEQQVQYTQPQMQQNVQAQPQNIDAAKLARITELEFAIERQVLNINHQAKLGFTTYSMTAELRRMQQELNDLNGTGVVNRVTSAVNNIAQYGQERIANQFIPNVGNATADLVANSGAVVANAVAGGGQWLANGAQWLAQGVQLGTNTIAQSVPVVTQFGQQVVNTGCGLGIK
jgi:hypothetical protein